MLMLRKGVGEGREEERVCANVEDERGWGWGRMP